MRNIWSFSSSQESCQKLNPLVLSELYLVGTPTSSQGLGQLILETDTFATQYIQTLLQESMIDIANAVLATFFVLFSGFLSSGLCKNSRFKPFG